MDRVHDIEQKVDEAATGFEISLESLIQTGFNQFRKAPGEWIIYSILCAFALSNPPTLSLVDGLSSGLGYSYVLLIIAFLRELLGSGSIWGFRVLGEWWTNWNIMIMAPGAFFMLALFIWVVKGNFMKEKKAGGASGAPQAASAGGKS